MTLHTYELKYKNLLPSLRRRANGFGFDLVELLVRKGTPETPTDIVNRLNEISFNAAIIGEMHAIALVQRLIEEDQLMRNSEAARLKNMNMHVISAEDQMRELDAFSKLKASMDFLLHLKEIGRKAADAWLTQNWQMIGEGSSVDIRQMFSD